MTRKTALSLSFLIIVLFIASLPASAAPRISLYYLTKSKVTASGPLVVPPNIGTVTAEVAADTGDRLKAEFVWFSPDGSEHSRHVKLGFPSGKGGPVAVSDNVSPEGEEGWWKVRISTGGESYEREFLVTSNKVLLGFAAGGVEEKISILGGADVGPDLLRLAMDDTDEDIRTAAVEAAARLDPSVWRAVFDRALDDGSAGVRLAAVESFSKTGGDCSVFEDRVLDDPVDYVRAAYADYIGSARPPESAEVLGRLITDPSENVRRAAVEVLSGMEVRVAAPVLVKGFGVQDPEFRLKLLKVLVEMRPDNLATVLADRLSDPARAVRTAAFDQLEGVDVWDISRARPLLVMEDEPLAGRALGLFIKAGDSDALTFALGSPYPSIRRDALEALRKAGGIAYTDALAASVSDPDPSIRIDSVKRLADLGKPGVTGLVKALEGTDESVKVVAAKTILDAAYPSAEGAMTALLDDPSPALRVYGLRYMNKTGSQGLAGAVNRLASDPAPEVRAAVMDIAGKRDSEDYSRALSVLYDNGDIPERYAAVRYLAQRDDRYAVRVMVDALNDPEDRVRLIAVKYIRKKEPSKLTIKLASDPDRDVRDEALKGLAAVPGAGAAEALEDIVTDANPANRKLALEILGGIEGPEAGRLVSRLVDDTSPEVRRLARDMVRSRPDSGAIDGLLRLTGSDDPNVRKTALEALDGHPCSDVSDALGRLAASPLKSNRLYALKKTASCGSPGLAAFATGMLDDPEYAVRMAAVDALHNSGGRKAEAGLVRALGNKDGRVRYDALESLVDIRSESYKRLLPDLVTDTDVKVAGLATDEALSLRDGDLKVRSLIAATTGPYPGYAVKALKTLMPMGDARALGVLMEYFRRGYDKSEVLSAMARVPGEAAVGPLSEAYRMSSGDASLRETAVAALAGRGSNIEGALTEALADPSTSVRLTAVDAASTINDGEVKGRLMSLALKDDSLRGRVLNVMSDDPADITLLGRLSAGVEDAGFRLGVVRLLVDKDADTGAVLHYAGDTSEDVRETVVKKLEHTPGATAVYGLLLAGDPSDPGLREEVRSSVAKRPVREVVGAVDMLFSDGRPEDYALSLVSESVKDPDVLERMVSRIGRDDCGLLQAVVGPMLKETKEYQAGALVESMGRCGRDLDLRIIDALPRIPGGAGPYMAKACKLHPGYGIELLDAAAKAGDTDSITRLADASVAPEMKARAMELLTDPDSPDTTRLLESGLRDESAAVRMSAAKSAARLRMNGLLIEAASAQDPQVRLSSVAGLKLMSSPAGYQALGRLALDADPAVSDAALHALDEAVKTGRLVPTRVWRDIVTAPDASENARLSAVGHIADAADPADAELLAGLLSGYGGAVADRARNGLISIGKPSLIYVYPLLDDEGACKYAAGVVAGIADPSSVTVLSEKLVSAVGDNRLLLIGALGSIGGDNAVEALCAEYGRGGDDVQAAVLKALAEAGAESDDPRVTEVIRSALDSPDETVRFYGAHAAGRLAVTPLAGEMDGLIAREKSRVVKKKLEDAKKAIAAASGHE